MKLYKGNSSEPLIKKKPFRRFKDTLINNSDQLMRAWSKFEMNKKIDALKFQIQLIIDANED